MEYYVTLMSFTFIIFLMNDSSKIKKKLNKIEELLEGKELE